MVEIRVFRGVGNHASDPDEDVIHIQELEEGSELLNDCYLLSVQDLIPDDLRVDCCWASWGIKCFKYGESFYKGEPPCVYMSEDGICYPPRFKFKITVEVEPVDVK